MCFIWSEEVQAYLMSMTRVVTCCCFRVQAICVSNLVLSCSCNCNCLRPEDLLLCAFALLWEPVYVSQESM